MTTAELTQSILNGLEFMCDEDGREIGRTETYEEAGIMSNDDGLIIQIDGKAFYITVTEQ